MKWRWIQSKCFGLDLKAIQVLQVVSLGVNNTSKFGFLTWVACSILLVSLENHSLRQKRWLEFEITTQVFIFCESELLSKKLTWNLKQISQTGFKFNLNGIQILKLTLYNYTFHNGWLAESALCSTVIRPLDSGLQF